MLKITNWQNIRTLPINPALLNQLKQHLQSPFSYENEAQSIWSELECELWMISSLSDISSVGVDGNSITINCRDRLTFALENIEFEDELEQDYLLTLAILNSSGQGLYLLMPKSLKSELMDALGVNHEL
ncbi:hypothetical protein [Shewanella sp. 10N.286.48.B5]|uniref:hypothetical protein n=1 Tax=Shewanella sp. 10N.286.48.B5 TaxID=1880834 RepID=UPI000C814C2A|nr:hypothetical protein [Shewanella sp. 10N.286.48.B5]PMH87894.1 hypothetical protein BCU57_20240 [Shewanella sp. 10N.286.48.B5]